MHIPDGYLGPYTYGGLWAAMVPIWIFTAQKVKRGLETARIPLVAMASVFSLVAMVFAIPIPGGTTGHLNGSTLVAILLGPWPALLAISVALGIQAVAFGEGGITALGANCFNIAFIGSLTGYGCYRLLTASRIPRAICGGIAAYLSLNLSGLFTALELGVQPLLHQTSSSYFPYSLKVAIPAVMIPHLTLLGFMEATLTFLVLVILLKSQPGGWTSLKKTSFFIFLGTLLLFIPISVFGHDFWIEKKGNELFLVFGHGSKREEFDLSKVKQVKAFDLNGKEISINKEKRGPALLLKTDQPPSLIFAEIDNGYWSKTIYGWKNLPKRKATRVVESNRSLFYSKSLLRWSEAVTKPQTDQGLEVLPLANPFEFKTGALLPIKVLYQGKPLSGVDVEGGDHQKIATTDKEGIANLTITKEGHQLISVSIKEPLKNDLDADYLMITSTLTFEVTK